MPYNSTNYKNNIKTAFYLHNRKPEEQLNQSMDKLVNPFITWDVYNIKAHYTLNLFIGFGRCVHFSIPLRPFRQSFGRGRSFVIFPYRLQATDLSPKCNEQTQGEIGFDHEVQKRLRRRCVSLPTDVILEKVDEWQRTHIFPTTRRHQEGEMGLDGLSHPHGLMFQRLLGDHGILHQEGSPTNS